jgi:YD repeat-containing protein
MATLRINHVSIPAFDLEESARFYEELLGMQRVPNAMFAAPTIWMRLGDQQLHLYLRGDQPLKFQHLAIDVDNFEEVFLRAMERGIVDAATLGAFIRSHPTGWVQMYVRDPAGNLVEIDCPDVSTLSDTVRAQITPLETVAPQTGPAATATIYLTAAH